jgi:tripartite-type tricarboxylate transporter receptor subunit TctC
MQNRRRLVLKASTLIAPGGHWSLARAETYPARSIKIVVPSGAGGSLDVEVRRIAQLLAKALGQGVIVDNRPGGSYVIGTTAVARAAPDGYTLLAGSNTSISVAPVLMPKLAYHPLKNFEPVIQTAKIPAVLVINPTLGVRTVRDLISLAKAQPGKLAYASNGVASLLHLMTVVFCQTAGVEMLHVPYKGTGMTVTSIISNETQLGFDYPATSVAHIKAGKLAALLVTGKQRVPLLPDVPTAAELGLEEVEFLGWGGLLAPAGTPKHIVARLNSEVRGVLKLPEIRAHYERIGGEAVGNSPEEFRVFIASDLARMERIVKLTGVKMEQ